MKKFVPNYHQYALVTIIKTYEVVNLRILLPQKMMMGEKTQPSAVKSIHSFITRFLLFILIRVRFKINFLFITSCGPRILLPIKNYNA